MKFNLNEDGSKFMYCIEPDLDAILQMNPGTMIVVKQHHCNRHRKQTRLRFLLTRKYLNDT
jgi:hypothetical protein